MRVLSLMVSCALILLIVLTSSYSYCKDEYNRLVGSDGLVNPVAQVGHTGVHSRGTHIAVGGAPRHNAHKGPHTAALTNQGATGVTLKQGTFVV